ncbi:hypothetical protein [Desmospora activa]|uniref:Uncharacterized protein n=1 Tax=Desmospora activa DSM 45169 TaxID=1121389 RepID=A0A2T4ZA66_9BACL|nr:hypothetical protein [Desmospora activa]PTM58763.1 hypothetical protein C8J48_1353 [Desmospora activa DSM 45169]
MTERLRLRWIPVILGTVIAVNLMLVAMLVARETTALPESLPALSQPGTPRLTTDYQMELEKTTREGNWVVEHYRQVKVRLDTNGREVDRNPTSEVTHIRYWQGKE